MSLDFYIHSSDRVTVEQGPCPHCGQAMPAQTEEPMLFSANITHNLYRMWQEAGVHNVLYESHGKRAAEIRETIAEGVAAMACEPERFRTFDASNRWGTYENALPWLRSVLSACTEYPDGVIRISK